VESSFQCSKKHRWPAGESGHCPTCFRPSEDVVKHLDDMCPSCAVSGKLWLGVSGLSYCDHCGFECDTRLNPVQRLQSILDFKKK
jgi:NMD protein affecting ribosome stability and mRNA decay